jgi:hypothetical protein
VATGIIFSRANSRLETPQLRPLDILRQNLEIINFPIKKIERERERERERDAAEHEMAELRSRMKKASYRLRKLQQTLDEREPRETNSSISTSTTAARLQLQTIPPPNHTYLPTYLPTASTCLPAYRISQIPIAS